MMRFSGYRGDHMRGVITIEAETAGEALVMAQLMDPRVVGVAATVGPLTTERDADACETAAIIVARLTR